MKRMKLIMPNKGNIFETREWCIENASYLGVFCLSSLPEIEYNGCQLSLHLIRTKFGLELVLGVVDASRSSHVEVSYISSDGSLLCHLEERDLEWDDQNKAVIPNGPKLHKLIDAVTKNGKSDEFKDILTIRCRLKRYAYAVNIYTHTKICASDFCLRVPSQMFKNDHFLSFKEISSMLIPFNGEKKGFKLHASLSKELPQEAAVQFRLSPNHNAGMFEVRTCTAVLDKNGDVLESFPNRRHLKDTAWVFSSDEVKLVDVMDESRVVEIRFTFISNDVRNKVAVKGNGISVFFETKLESTRNVTVLSENLEDLYTDAAFSDFELRCEQQTFQTHKSILSARSPVFKSLLCRGMKYLEITDMDAQTLSKLLDFVYSGTVRDLEWVDAMNLYRVAHKYDIISLKKICMDFFSGYYVSTNNCGNTLV